MSSERCPFRWRLEARLWRSRSVQRSLVAAGVLFGLTTACGDGVTKPDPGGGLPPPERPTLAQTYRPSGHMAAGDVVVHLFDWKWTDIAMECETVLAPAGFKAVQVSPPQEHSIVPSHDWSERYQPVSYSVERSRSGTGPEFRAMVSRCHTVGVDIIVDAVINHMTNFPSPGVGSNGTAYTKYSYPGLYTSSDFHTACGITNYQSAANVQDCELLSLPDLDTGSESVRQKIAGYLISLARMGVAGFRIDAAKHIQQVQLDDIIKRTNETLAGEGKPLPYFFLEVVGNGVGEALGPRDYFGEGFSSGGASDITEFTFVGVGNKFRGINGEHISQLNPNGTSGNRFSEVAWGLMPSEKAVVFLQNHDTQHDCGISYRSGDAFRLANVWMLAQPYGYPSVLSSFVFICPTGNSMGPPSNGPEDTRDVSCAASFETATLGDWVCEHRDPSIRNMVGFRRVVAGTEINGWWDDGVNAIAFSRGNKGFVAINNEAAAVALTVTTTMVAGTYCDRLTGGLVSGGGACRGTAITVGADGTIQLTLPSGKAIAIDITTRR
ncbi:MAG: alpha-amylase family protein [Gemmatimonadaceae bacterium]